MLKEILPIDVIPMSSVVKVSEFDVDQFSFEPFPEKY